MKTMNLEFDGKTYVCRVVNSNDGEELVIAPTSLLDALHPHSFGEKTTALPTKKLCRLMKRCFSTPTMPISHYPTMNWWRN